MKKYVITSYIPGSTTNKSCFNAIKNYMEVNKIDKLLTLPTKANYIEEQEELPDEGFEPAVGGFFLNKSLYVSDMLLNHNLLDPIRGLESISSEKGSLIVAAPRHRFKSVARSLKHSAMPRGIWCTGTISDPYYKDTSSGLKVRNYHTFGALVVTIQNNKIFHIRQLEFVPKTNSLCDMNIEYFANGNIRKIRPSISLGDLHPPFTNPDILNKTSELIKDLKCENVIYHDAFDFAQPGSHHLEGRYLTKAFAQESIYTIENEVNITMRVLNFLANNSSKDTKHYIVASNHNEHLDKYLDSFRWRDDTGNLLYALELVMQKVKYKRGMEKYDSLEYALRKSGLSDKFTFLRRKDFLAVHGIEVSNHGDFGANGSRSGGAAQALAFSSGKVITGHEHSPSIGVYNNYVNGTMTHLTMPYTNDSGTSSWLNTHTLIYPNGGRSHIHIIKG